MALVLSLSEGDTFNVGYRRFRLAAVHYPAGCTVLELGAAPFEIGIDKPVSVSKAVTLREGLRQQKGVVRLMIAAPKSERIWRGDFDQIAPVSLLAPVPEEHLISGQAMCSEAGRVAFGSRDFEVFQKLDGHCDGTPCRALLYASSPKVPAAGPPRVTWTATYLRTVPARSDGSKPAGVFRPFSTESDSEGHWGVYWEVTDIRRLEAGERIPVSSLRGVGSTKPYLKTFHPERPLIIDAV